MKIFIVYTVSFILALILGVSAEVIIPDLGIYVRKLSDMPLPFISEWIYHFSSWQNRGLLCLFILPWACLVLYGLSMPRSDSSLERHIRLLYGFLFFVIGEAILSVFFGLFSLLPFIPHYCHLHGAKSIPLEAYGVHFLLAGVAVGIIVVGVIRFCRRHRPQNVAE